MIGSEFVVFFPEAKPDTALLGGKGSNLIKLIKMKLSAKVPPGFIINTNCFKKFLKESKYYDQLSNLFEKTLNPKEILHHSAKITKLILESKIPKKIVESIEGAFDKLVKGKDIDLSFAVRSSATIEDSSKFSFAGQAESYLYNLTFHDLLQSLNIRSFIYI
jgi:pyruvate,water dikinase